MSAAYNGTLAFDMRHSGSGTLFNSTDVRLTGGATPVTLVYDIAANPTSVWSSFAVPFSEGAWRTGSLTGAFATAEDIMGVLSALTALRIRGEYIEGTDTGRLDNVSLNAPEPVPEPATLALMGTGVAGLALFARRRHRAHRRALRRESRHAYVEPSWVSM